MATKLPVRKAGVRRNKPTRTLTGQDTPSVSPIQDPGLSATQGAFGGGVGAAVQQVGQDLQGVAIQKQQADNRIMKAQLRKNAKHDNNNSLVLVDEFEQEELKIFNALVADNKLGDVDFNEKYGAEVDKLFSSTLEGSTFSSAEAKIDFQGKLLESRFTLGDDRGLKNTTKLEERQTGIARNELRKYQISNDRVGEGFSTVIGGARDMIENKFGDLLSESSEKALINEVVIAQFEPQMKAFLAGGFTDDARALLEHPDVSSVLSPTQWRGNQQRIELVENNITEEIIKNNTIDGQTASRLNKPISQLTPTERADGRSGRDASFEARKMVEKAKVMFKTENPSSEQIQIAARVASAATDPNQKLKDVILIENGKQLNFLRNEGRSTAESNLQAINIGQAALTAKGADGKPAFEPGSLAGMRTAMSKTLTLLGVTQEQIDRLPFKLGNATMSDLLSKSLANLALTQADKISRVTNMSIQLVREVWGTIGSTPEGLAIIFEIAEDVERRNLAIADLADREANRIVSPDSASSKDLEPFNEQLATLKKEWGDRLEENITEKLAKFVSAQAKAQKDKKAGDALAKLSPADRALVGKPFAQGSKILGFSGDRVSIEKADGTRVSVPRSAVDRFNQENPEKEPEPTKKKVEKPSKPVSAPRPKEATGQEAVDGSKSGLREDGTPKGEGFLGRVERPDGGISTELSVGIEIDGEEILIPAMVPGLTKKELDTIVALPEGSAKDFPESVMKKAVAHARARIAEGKSPFLEDDDLTKPQTPSKLDTSKTPNIKPRTPAKKDVAKKDKFSDDKAVGALSDEAFERFISTTPADRRSANVNKVISDRLKSKLKPVSTERFSTPAKVKKELATVTATVKAKPKGVTTAEQNKIFSALIDQESGGRVGLKSKAGAMGLAQIMPGTAKLIADKSDLGLTKEQILNDPEANMKAGFWLLFSDTWPRFSKTDDQLAFSLADYNGNPSLRRARAKLKGKDKNIWAKVEPLIDRKETRAYVKSIMKRLGK